MSKLSVLLGKWRFFFRDEDLVWQLNYLSERGHKALGSKEDIEKFPVQLWFEAVDDVLIKLMSSSSWIYNEFKQIRSSFDSSEIERKTAIHDTKFILDQAIKKFETPEAPAAPSDPVKILVHRVHGKPEDIKEIDIDTDQLDRYIQTKITEKYLESRLAKIQGVILVLMLFLAVLGIVQISNFRVDLSQITNEAIDSAKQEISEQVESIKSELEHQASEGKTNITTEAETQREAISNQVADIVSGLNKLESDETSRITTETDEYIDSLKKETAPDIRQTLSDLNDSVDEIEGKVGPLDEQLSAMQNQIIPLEKAIEAIGLPDQGELDQAISVLFTSRYTLIIIFGVSILISVILSIYIIARRKKWGANPNQ